MDEYIAEVLRLATLRGSLLTMRTLKVDPTHRKIMLIKIIREADIRSESPLLTLREYKLLVDRYVGF